MVLYHGAVRDDSSEPQDVQHGVPRPDIRLGLQRWTRRRWTRRARHVTRQDSLSAHTNWQKHRSGVGADLPLGPLSSVAELDGVDTNLNDVVDQGEQRCQRVGWGEERDVSVLNDHLVEAARITGTGSTCFT